jgi:outer membrane protein assembly factor BamE (lipoprotein component of BamABCDE complex)
MVQSMIYSRYQKRMKTSAVALGLLAGALALTACNSTTEVFSHGYQLNEETLALVPEGSSREQVLLSLGTPSTTDSQPNGIETFYYISQKKSRTFAFQKPEVIDQRVLAIYMNQESTVEKIANYGLKDGKVFDFVQRVTPTGGKELSFLNQLLRAGTVNPFGT